MKTRQLVNSPEDRASLEQSAPKEMIEELLKLVGRKAHRKRQPMAERHHWLRLEDTLSRASSGKFFYRRPGYTVTHDDIAMWALNCAMLINGLSYHWLPLSNSTTISQARKRKRKKLPRPLHNMMVLSAPNRWTRQYISLVEGGWKVP